jgi:hypothetical protein
MAEDGKGAVAPFLVLDGTAVTRYEAPYDVNAVLRAFIATGVHRRAPEMCRMVAQVMQTAEYQGVLKLVRHVSAVAASTGLTLGEESAWKAADQTYPWAEDISSEEYWNQLEKQL